MFVVSAVFVLKQLLQDQLIAAAMHGQGDEAQQKEQEGSQRSM